jgi:23S rRNA pseudouridine2605 synthase
MSKPGGAARPARSRPSFRRDDERGAERPPRKAFGGGDRTRRDGDEARPPQKRPSFRRDDERGGERPPRQAFGDRKRADAGDAKPYRKDGPPRRFERPRARDDDAPRPERKHFSRPRDDRRDARPSREAEHGRGRWQEHPRSERRDDARPPRPATGSDRPFRKRPAFDAPTVRAPRKPRAVQAPPPPRPDKSGERIAKVVARAGLASRREAEAWITAGRVAVNGRVITSPALDVTVRDVVTVDGQRLPEPERTRLFLYHKPRGLMTTHADPEGRPTVFDNLPEGLPRLISVGRLDFNTEGLLLLTNDGGLARALELPQTGWLRRYRVRADGEVTQPQLDALRGGIVVDGIKYGSIEATLEREQGSNVWLVFAIREGKNREVRNVLAHLGLDVTRLIRVSYGPFQLGEIEEGKVEEVKTRVLREQIGETLLRRAGSYFAPAAAEAAPSQAKAPGKPRVKRAVVADRKGRKVVVERAGGDDGEPRRDGSAPYRRPQRRYHGKRDLTRKEP